MLAWSLWFAFMQYRDNYLWCFQHLLRMIDRCTWIKKNNRCTWNKICKNVSMIFLYDLHYPTGSKHLIDTDLFLLLCIVIHLCDPDLVLSQSDSVLIKHGCHAWNYGNKWLSKMWYTYFVFLCNFLCIGIGVYIYLYTKLAMIKKILFIFYTFYCYNDKVD